VLTQVTSEKGRALERVLQLEQDLGDFEQQINDDTTIIAEQEARIQVPATPNYDDDDDNGGDDEGDDDDDDDDDGSFDDDIAQSKKSG
jgi:hypothetical protein